MCASLAGVERSWWADLCKREGKKGWWSLISVRCERRQGEIWFGWRRAGILLQLLPLLPWQVNETSAAFQKCHFQLYPSFQSVENNMVLLLLFSWPVSTMSEVQPQAVCGRRKRGWFTLAADVAGGCWLRPCDVYLLSHGGAKGQMGMWQSPFAAPEGWAKKSCWLNQIFGETSGITQQNHEARCYGEVVQRFWAELVGVSSSQYLLRVSNPRWIFPCVWQYPRVFSVTCYVLILHYSRAKTLANLLCAEWCWRWRSSGQM